MFHESHATYMRLENPAAKYLAIYATMVSCMQNNLH